MFEVGKRYNFKTVEHDGYSTWNASVVSIEANLLLLEEDGRQWIFNTAATSFERAKVNNFAPLELGDLVINLTDKDGSTQEYRPGVG